MSRLAVSKEDMRIFTIEAMIDVMERALAGKAFEAIRSLASHSRLSKLRDVIESDDLTSRPLDEAIRRVNEALRADTAA
jgi:hypothetical protein